MLYNKNNKIKEKGNYEESNKSCRGHNIPDFPSVRRHNRTLGGGGIFDSGKNEQLRLEETLATSTKITYWGNSATLSYAGGNGTKSNPYKIQTAEQLANFSNSSITENYNYSGVYFSIEADIDLSGKVWYSSSDMLAFAGNINGNNHIIKGLTCFGDDRPSFMKFVRGATIKNIYFKDIFFQTYQDGEDFAGLFAYTYNTEISNIVVDNITIQDDDGIPDFAIGTIAGKAESSTITNCLVKNAKIISTTTSSTNGYIGGLIGQTTSGTSVTNCCAINVILTAMTSGKTLNSLVGGSAGTITGSYADAVIYSPSKSSVDKMIYGSSSNFGSWMYSPNLNGGYPVQKVFLTIGGSSSQTSAQVYNHLVSLGFSN